MGRIVELDEDKAVIQVFEGTENMSLDNTHTRLTGHPMEVDCVRRKCWAVHLTESAKPIDGLGPITACREAGCKRTSVKSGQTGISAKLYPYRNFGN